MAEEKGLDQIPIRLTPEQARIIAAHAQLSRDLERIKYPKSGRWESRETAIEVLEALARYLSAISDEEVDDEIVVISRHTELLQDVITHFLQASWGTMDRRLTPDMEGAARAAHDDAIIAFKRGALVFVDMIAKRERAKGTKDPVAEARRQVAKAYREEKLTIPIGRGGKPKDITSTLLESWDKRPPEGRRPRAK